jgi:hypothetical protein
VITAGGLPIVGPHIADALALRARRALEQALAWPQPHPLVRKMIDAVGST